MPQCWTWDESTFGALNSSSDLYTSSYTLSADKRTVTATISTPPNTLSKVSLANLQATPSGDCANGSTYKPELVITESGASTTYDSGYPMTVVNEPKLEISKVAQGSTGEGSCAGITGTCVYQNFDLRINPPAGTGYLGAANYKITEPLILTDTYTISPDITSEHFYVLQMIGGGTATLQSFDPATNTAKIAVTNIPNPLPTTGIAVRVRIAVPRADAPAFSASAPTNVSNTVSAQPTTTDGTPIVDPNTTNNTAAGRLQQVQQTTGTRPVVNEKMIYTTKDPSTPLYDQYPDDTATGPFMPVASGAINSAGTVGTDATIYARVHFRPKYDIVGSTYTVNPATNLSLYDFWDPTQQQIIDVPAWVGSDAKVKAAATDYKLQYTNTANLNDLSDPASFTWVDSIAAAGGPTKVNGIRMVWLANNGTYAPAWSNTTAFLNLVQPFKVVQSIGGIVDDTSRIKSNEYDFSLQRFTTVVGPDLVLAKAVSPTSTASGSTVTYTLNPKVQRPAGTTTNSTINGVQVVDKLPPGIIAVSTAGVDPAWSVEQTGSAADGITLTFTYQGQGSTATPLPPIVFKATTDTLAPASGQYVNTAVISGQGNDQPEQVRTAQAVLNISQANVTASTKVVDGPSTIDVGAKSVSWQNSWYNFQEASQGAQTFYDVLPYNGDARGTKFGGTAQLASLALTGSAKGTATVYVTTDAPASVASDPRAATWVAQSAYTGSLADVTALRVDVPDFTVNYAGGLHLTMNISGQHSGDIYSNDLQRYGGSGTSATFVGKTNPATVNVVASSVSGTVWWDVNRDGVRQSGETLVAGAKVTVTAADTVSPSVGGKVRTTTTAADGTWSVGELSKGNYTVTITRPDGSNVTFTLTNVGSDDTVDSDVAADGTASVTLPEGKAVTHVDAGLIDAALAVSKTVESAPGSGKYIEADSSDNLTGTYVWGNEVKWKIVVSNTGKTTLTDVVVTDVVPYAVSADSCGLAAGQKVTLAPSGSTTIECSSTAYESVTNTAKAVYGEITAENTAAITVRANTGVSVVKQVESAPGSGVFGESADAKPGDQLAWKFTVKNTGDVTLTNVKITDDFAAASMTLVDGAPAECVAMGSADGYVVATLAAGDSVVVQCTTIVTESATNVVNVDSTAVVVPGGEPTPVTGTDSASVGVTASIGGTVWWDVNRDGVRQDGEKLVADAAVTVTDDAGKTYSATTAADGAWSVSELPKGTYTVTVTRPDGTNVTFTEANVGDEMLDSDVAADGTAQVTLPGGKPVHTVDAGLVDASLTLSKTVESEPGSGDYIEADDSDGLTGTYVWGDEVKWQITITNGGVTDLPGVVVTDVVPYADSADSCGLAAGMTVTLAAGESKTLTCTSTAYESVVNTATATFGAPANNERVAAAAAGTVTAEDTAAITVRADVGVEVAKEVETAPGSGVFGESSDAGPGDQITWQITVTNTGDVTLTDIKVTDDFAAGGMTLTSDAPAECAALGSADGLVIDSLLAGDSVVVQCTTIVTSTATNVANVDGTAVVVPGGEPTPVTGTDTADVTVTAPPVPPTPPTAPPVTPTPPRPAAKPALAVTGVSVAPGLWTALALLGAGALMLAVGRGRRTS